MNLSRTIRSLLLIILLMMLSGCNGSGSSNAETVDAAVALTVEADAWNRAATQAAKLLAEPSEPTEPPEPPPPPPAPTETRTITHVLFPQTPGGNLSTLTDRSSADFAEEHRTIGDSFNINLFERPFTRGEMNYIPHLDIIFAGLDANNDWLYVTIQLEEAPPEDTNATYGIELDLDLDGRGDWYIAGMCPPTSDWTTDGVRVFHDANGDVGGETPMSYDDPDPALDGYEVLVFDQGLGPDPDSAWIRREPNNSDEIQLAIKHELFESDLSLLWGVWSDARVKRPAWLDYNDHFTNEEAGDPAIISEYYPIKELAAMDNTCRYAFGFSPTGSEPGICDIPPEEQPEPGEIRLIGCKFRGVAAVYPCILKESCGKDEVPCTP